LEDSFVQAAPGQCQEKYRKIFIGSSSEGEKRALEIADLLQQDPTIRCVMWRSIFEPGYVTFEALEEMLLECCGAVFVASPDDDSKIRGKSVKTPRANVLLEFGLVAGRLGRHNIALCQYGCAELPSDLRGLTVINMEPSKDPSESDKSSQLPQEQLRIWSSRLATTVDRVPRTEIVHGYSGRWEFEISIDMWRDLVIGTPNFVHVKGHLDLLLHANGQSGKGLSDGELFFRIFTPGSQAIFQGEYRTVHEISNALCSKDGSLELTTEAFALQKVTSLGEPPPQLLGWDFSTDPWTAKWNMQPCGVQRSLQGEFHAAGVITSRGRVKMTKVLAEAGSAGV